MKPMRANVLVDLGPLQNQLGAKLIETPAKYKRLSSEGKIVAVGEECRMFTQEDKGKTVIISVTKCEDERIAAKHAESLGLAAHHWHALIHESKVVAFLE